MSEVDVKAPGARHRFDDIARKKVISWLKRQVINPSAKLLTWSDIEHFSGFSKMRLSRDPSVVAEYKLARMASKKACEIARAASGDGRHAGKDPGEDRQHVELIRLRQQTDEWLLLWERWQYNAKRMGWDSRELEKPLPPPIHRTLPNHSGGKN